MAGPLASPPDVDAPDGGPLVMGVDDERADEVLSALSSTTTRRLLAALHDDPAPPSALAKRLDTTIQNVQYHLEKLVDAGLVEAAGTTYSEKGREMTVYRPADRALVFVAGPKRDPAGGEGLLATLKRLLGGVGVLGLASLVVDRLLGPTAQNASGDPQAGYQGTEGGAGTANQNVSATVADGAGTETPARTGAKGTDAATQGTDAPQSTGGAQTDAAGTADGAATGTPAPQQTGTEAARDTVSETASTVADATAQGTPEMTRMATETVAATDGGLLDAVAASPGLLFFLGGLTALLFALVVWNRR